MGKTLWNVGMRYRVSIAFRVFRMQWAICTEDIWMQKWRWVTIKLKSTIFWGCNLYPKKNSQKKDCHEPQVVLPLAIRPFFCWAPASRVGFWKQGLQLILTCWNLENCQERHLFYRHSSKLPFSKTGNQQKNIYQPKEIITVSFLF